jgi:Putative peptidoglycan binding domain
MIETLRSRATAEARSSFRVTVLWEPCRLAAGGILFAIVCTISAGASAQWDAVLRNLMQNTMPASPPGMSAYPPSNPGYPPPSAAPPNAGYPAYAAPPSTAYHPPPHASSAAPDAGMVADLQRVLNELGYDAGPADGAPGSRTIQAVRAFQRDHGQPPSDEVTAATLASVRSVWYERNRTAASTSVAANQTSERPSFDCARATSPAAAPDFWTVG